MKDEDAVTIVGIISDVITSRRGASLFPNGKEGLPSSLGSIWIDVVAKIPEEDADLATRAAVELMTGMTEIPTVTDFRETLQKLRKDRRMKMPALPEPEFVREVPDWVKGKVLALFRKDFRVWPDQKPGYDTLQVHNSAFRTYVWPDQEKMPEEDQARYIAEGQRLTAKDFGRIFTLVTGG